KIRKPLRQVDGVVRVAQPRHLSNDRLGELQRFLRTRKLRHSGVGRSFQGRRILYYAAVRFRFFGGAGAAGLVGAAFFLVLRDGSASDASAVRVTPGISSSGDTPASGLYRRR